MKKSICLLMSVAVLGSLMSFDPIKNISGNSVGAYAIISYENNENVVAVNSEFLLRKYINESTKNKKIKVIFTSDIKLHNSIEINSDIDIDLNGHKLIFKSSDLNIVIGQKTLKSKIPYQVYHEGHFETKRKVRNNYNDTYSTHNSTYHNNNLNAPFYYNPYNNAEYSNRYNVSNTYNTSNTVEYEDIWVPGYYETKYKNVYEYNNDICVSISNGKIFGHDAPNADSKEHAYWYSDAHGYDATSPKTMFELISGKLFLENVLVKCGNGGKGGNATYSSVWHIPVFGGGNGGNGGKGGNGGSIFNSDEGKVFIDRDCILNVGKGGNGGKGSKCNPNYWILSGSHGKNGKNGSEGNIINDESKISM